MGVVVLCARAPPPRQLSRPATARRCGCVRRHRRRTRDAHSVEPPTPHARVTRSRCAPPDRARPEKITIDRVSRGYGGAPHTLRHGAVKPCVPATRRGRRRRPPRVLRARRSVSAWRRRPTAGSSPAKTAPSRSRRRVRVHHPGARQGAGGCRWSALRQRSDQHRTPTRRARAHEVGSLGASRAARRRALGRHWLRRQAVPRRRDARPHLQGTPLRALAVTPAASTSAACERQGRGKSL